MGKAKSKKQPKRAPLQTQPPKAVTSKTSEEVAVTTPVTPTTVMPTMVTPIMVAPVTVAPKPASPVIPPVVTQVATEEEPSHRGFIYEHRYVNGGLKYSRVLDTQGRFLILYQPSAAIPLYTEITFTEGTYKGKPTVLAPVAVKAASNVGQLMEHIKNPDVQANPNLSAISLDRLASDFVQKTMVGEPKEHLRNFLAGYGVKFIIGIIDNTLVYEMDGSTGRSE